VSPLPPVHLVNPGEIKRIVAQDLPVQEKLRRIIRFQVTYVATHKSLVQVFFSEMSTSHRR